MVLTSLLIFVLSTQFTYAIWGATVGKITEIISGFRELFSIGGMIGIVFRVLTVLVDTILGQLVSFAGWIFDWSLSLVANANTSIIATGWGVSLGFANNLFILILLAIAIGTILELPTFNYKTMLPKFLMVALLINFSLAIGNVIIGTTNMIAKNFSKGITSETVANRFAVTKPMQLTEEKFKKDAQESEDKLKDPIKMFVGSFFLLIYKTFQYLLIIFVFLAGAVYMIARTFHLWLLLMLAPLAWISLLIPGLQQHWKSWWSKFIKWSIFAPAYLFFLLLGVQIMARKDSISTFNSFVGGHTTYGTLAAGIAGYIIQMLVVAFIMTSGLVISSQLGVGGSNFVINYGKNLKGAASKRFKELRSKGPLSAEKLGERFGGLGARGLAAVPGVGRLAGYRSDEVRGRLELERQKQQQEYMEKEKLRHVGQMAGMDETQKRQYLMNRTQSARNGTGPTSLGQAAAINMLMEDKVAMENVSETAQGYMRQAVAAAKSSTQSSGINVGYTVTGEMAKKMREVQERASKTQVEANKENIEREMVSLASEDMTVLYQMAQNAISTNSASARDVAAMKVMQDRKAEASLLLSRVFATPEERVKFWSNAKLGVGAGEEGQSTTQYIR